jgi:hypothetical protein
MDKIPVYFKAGRSFKMGRVMGLRNLAAFCFSAFLMMPQGLFAQVDRSELQKDLGPVEFINYEGPYSRIETRAQIRGIGYSLGLGVRAGQTRTGGQGRYFVIHSVSAAEGDKLDADIFSLGIDVGVDHIRNLRLIIQGYLEGAYDYSAQDAGLLAQYVTIYNAVYRGDWDYFTFRYKKPVMDNQDSGRAGLSIRFDEWPGRTRMMIPIGIGGSGSLSAIDTTSLADDRITEELRKEDDRGVEQRKEMVDLKEREADEAREQAAVRREAAGEQERKAAEERRAVEEERRQIAQERRNPEAGREDLNRREQQNQERERAAERGETEAARQRQEAQKQEEFADKKAEEAQKERESIAEDQQALIANRANVPEAPAAGAFGAIILSPDSPLGRLVKVNLNDGREMKRSTLNTINTRTIILTGGRIIAIAGENRGNGAIRLIEINGDSLEMVKQGDDDIAPQSLLWVNGADLYAVSSAGGSLYLARFNTGLGLEARSLVTVHPFAAVTFQEGILMTQRADGSPLILDQKSLAEKRY